MKRTIFLPIISIDDKGTMECEWSGSYSNTQDMDSPTFEDVDDSLGEPHCTMLDTALTQIRSMLATRTIRITTSNGTVDFMDLVRPFFVEA